MAKAKKCDICGNYYPVEENIYNLSLEKVTNGVYKLVGKIECCPDCFNKFNKIVEDINPITKEEMERIRRKYCVNCVNHSKCGDTCNCMQNDMEYAATGIPSCFCDLVDKVYERGDV